MIGYVAYEFLEISYYTSKILYNSISYIYNYIYNYNEKRIKNIKNDGNDIKYKVM